ncbi:MAG TPA: DUF167 domain-containing protein [Granulicella sp.]|jgi:uncharacterized protein (TIGR00251 family)|nr:DUF167 domain-containing protein [Granulicella sp.]
MKSTPPPTAPLPACLHLTADGCTLAVRVHPGARRNAITGTHADALKIALTTPPVDGRANQALIAFLADLLHLPKASIAVLTGATSRSKLLRITGRTAPEVQAALQLED